MSQLLPTNRAASSALNTPAAAALPRVAGVEPASDEIDLREVLSAARRRIGLILLVAIGVGAAAAAVVYRTPPTYRAHSVIRLKDARGSLTEGIARTETPQVFGRTADPVLSQIEVLRSRAVAGTVVDRLGLRLEVLEGGLRHSDFSNVVIDAAPAADSLRLELGPTGFVVTAGGHAVHGGYRQPVGVGGVQFVLMPERKTGVALLRVIPREGAIDGILRGLSANVREKTDVVDIQYVSADPEMAQRVANTFVESFQEVNARSARQDSHRRRVFVEEQLRQTDSLLSVYQQALGRFRSEQQLYSAKDKYAAEQENLMQLQARRGELAAQLDMYRSLLTSVAPGRNGTRNEQALGSLIAAPDLASNPLVASLYAELVKLETARDSIVGGRWGSSSRNPDVARLDTLILTVRGRIMGAVQSYVASLEARVAALDELQSRNEAVLSRLPGAESEESKLVQEVDITRNMADQLRAEYQKARIDEAVEAGQVEVVDNATLPAKAVGLGRSRKVALALLAGLLLGACAAFVVEKLNTSIRRREDLQEALNVPELALIPQIAPDQGRRRLPFRTSTNGRKGPVELVSLSDSRSSGAEAYRKLRTNLIFSQAIQSLRCLMVTSADAAEGKTTTVSNLAATFAQQNMRVLIVDGDMRRPRVHHAMGVERQPGLAQVLLGECSLSDAVQPTSVASLFVLTAGASPPNAAELLASEPVRHLFEELRQQFDFVFLDSPPINAAADALVMSRLADGVLLVVRAGRTDRATAQHAVQQLEHVGARIVGAVLNDPDAEVPRYDRYYAEQYYRYGYYGASK